MKRALLFMAVLWLPPLAWADQFAYIDPDTAQRAVNLLRNEKQLYFLCEPCGEKTGQIVAVQSVEFADVQYQGFHEVRINDQGIDLAYVYLRRGNRWKNAATQLGLAPHGVSAELPASKQPGEKHP